MTGTTTLTAAAARRAAAAILRERRFHAVTVPRPLHSVLHALGSILSAPVDFVNRLVGDLSVALPGGSLTGWILLAALAALAAFLLARRSSRKALQAEIDRGGAAAGDAVRPTALEREAEAAERDGRYGEAVRLRFRAGLERLREREVIGSTAAPTRELAGAVASPRFDALARRFDEIVYGASPAVADDAERARDDWRRVTRERGAR